MPNLDELLQDTPTHVFASIWFDWRKTKFYPTHYSELVRLATLYKYHSLVLYQSISHSLSFHKELIHVDMEGFIWILMS